MPKALVDSQIVMDTTRGLASEVRLSEVVKQFAP
jgi:hypothetical protein